MGNFSRDTFDALKHYVGVRLQQGVPLVDADWNEKEDIRKFEIEAFLKWFVGNGVPEGNQGFRIQALAGGGENTVVLTAGTVGTGPSSVTVNRSTSTAADALGFGPDNAAAARSGSSPARLTGDIAEPFTLADGLTLVISADGQPDETVTFQTADFASIGAATAVEVAAAINTAVTTLTAAPGNGNDFNISGGDGTAAGAGRCLVDGRDAISEGDLKYSAQPLYDNADLAAAWGVDPVPPLVAPAADRIDLVYLDIWEREINETEDFEHLVHPAIGLATCVRIKREWAIRVREGMDVPVSGDPDYFSGHSYYGLATVQRRSADNAVMDLDITDVRERQLLVPPATLITDLLGVAPQDYRRGQNRPPISLRGAINALLKGEIPATDPAPAASGGGNTAASDAVLEDSQQNFWAFFTSDRNGNQDIFLRRYFAGMQAWGADEAITTDPADDTDPVALQDSSGDIWLLWNSDQGAASQNIWSRRYRRTAGTWDAELELISSAENDFQHIILEDTNTNLWVLWMSLRDAGNPTLWLKRYIRGTDTWEADQQLITSSGMEQLPTATVDAAGTIFVLWQSNRDGDDHIWWNRYDSNVNPIGGEQRLDPASVNRQRSPRILIDARDNVWAFWRERIGSNYQIHYGRYNRSTDTWDTVAALTADAFDNRDPTPIEDIQGNIWVFWRSERTGGEVILYRIFNTATDSWGDERAATPVPGDYSLRAVTSSASGAVRVFWTEQTGPASQAIFRQFFPVI